MRKGIVKYLMINAVIFFLIFYLSSLTVLNGDDFRVQQFESGGLISSVSRAFEYTNDNYMHTNGRYWVVFVAALLAQLNKNIYNLINSLLFAFGINLIATGYLKDRRHTNWRDKCFHVLLAFSIMWIFIPSVWDVYLWLSGSIGYLWTTVVLLLYGTYWYNRFLFYWKNDDEEVVGPKKQKAYIKVGSCIVLSLGGIISGASQEPGACALIVALFAYLIYVTIYKKKKIPIEEWLGIIFSVLGLALLLLAPGNQERIAGVQSYVSSENANFVIKYGVRIVRETYYFLLYFCVPLGIYCFLFLVNKKDDVRWTKHFVNNLDSLVLIVTAIVSVYVMTFSAGFATRIFLFPLAVITIACIRELSKIDNLKILHSIYCLIISLTIFCIMSMAFAVKEYHTNGNRIERNMYTDDFYGNPELEVDD